VPKGTGSLVCAQLARKDETTWLFRALDELDHPEAHSAAAAIPRQPLNGVHHGLEPVAAEE
jgi:hypothetical protein